MELLKRESNTVDSAEVLMLAGSDLTILQAMQGEAMHMPKLIWLKLWLAASAYFQCLSFAAAKDGWLDKLGGSEASAYREALQAEGAKTDDFVRDVEEEACRAPRGCHGWPRAVVDGVQRGDWWVEEWLMMIDDDRWLQMFDMHSEYDGESW